jgi:hypothetical protein
LSRPDAAWREGVSPEDGTADAFASVIPAQVGIQGRRAQRPPSLDSRFRGNDNAADSAKTCRRLDL